MQSKNLKVRILIKLMTLVLLIVGVWFAGPVGLNGGFVVVADTFDICNKFTCACNNESACTAAGCGWSRSANTCARIWVNSYAHASTLGCATRSIPGMW